MTVVAAVYASSTGTYEPPSAGAETIATMIAAAGGD